MSGYEEILLSRDQKERMTLCLTDYDAVIAAMQQFFPADPRVGGLEPVRDTVTLVDALSDAQFSPGMIAAALTHAGMGGLAVSCNLMRAGGMRVHGNVGAIGEGAIGVVGVSPATAVAAFGIAAAPASQPPLTHAHVDGSVGAIGPGSFGVVPSSSSSSYPRSNEAPLDARMCSELKRLLTVENVVVVKSAFHSMYSPRGGSTMFHRVRRLDASVCAPSELVDTIGEAGLNQGDVYDAMFLAGLEEVARAVGIDAGRPHSIHPLTETLSVGFDTGEEAGQASAPGTGNLREQLSAIAQLHEDRSSDQYATHDISICNVCTTRVVALAFGPCGHGVMCIQCARELCSEDGVWLDCTGCEGTRVTSAVYFCAQ